MNSYVKASIIVMVVFTFIAVLSVILPLFFVGKRRMIKRPSYIDEALDERIDYILKKRNFFLRNSISWMMSFYALSVLSACSSILVLFLCAYPKDSDEVAIFVFSAVSLCMTIFIMAVNPQNYYVKFRRAFRILDDAINLIESEFTNDSNTSVTTVNNAIHDVISKSEDEMDD